MTLSDMRLVLWGFLGLVTTWRVIVVLRDPAPSHGRIAVAGLFGTAFLSQTFNQRPVADIVDIVRPGFSQLFAYVSLILFFAGFVYFFASGTYGPRSRLSSLRVQMVAPAVFTILLAVSWLLSPRDQGLGNFSYLIMQGYMFYGTIASTFLAWKAGTGRPQAWKWTFRTCSVGMAMCAIGGPIMRTPGLISLVITGHTLGPLFGGTATMLNVAGIIVVLTGLSLVGARSWLDRLGALLAAKRGFLVLRPLWDLLYETYPSIALYGRRSYLRELLAVGPSAGYLFRRRAVECRDGLWRLSPYVADPENSDDEEGDALTIDEQARLVLDAAERVQRGDEPLAGAVAIAAPPEEDQRTVADDEALIALARAIRHHRNMSRLRGRRSFCGIELARDVEAAVITRAAGRPTAPE